MGGIVAPAFTGALATWQSRGAIKIGGLPFETFAEAEEACKAMLRHLTSDD
jgi:hypothetical protein